VYNVATKFIQGRVMSLDYSLAVINVAEIPTKKLSKLNEDIHDLLREKYPLKVEELAKNVSVNIDEENNANTVTKTTPIFSFVSADRNDAITITCERISFHTKSKNNTKYVIDELLDVFTKIVETLDIKHVGNVAIRHVYNFSLNDDGSTFNGFFATNLLAPTIKSMQSKGPSMFEASYLSGKNILRLKGSVQMDTHILPIELMDSAAKQLKISTDKINVLARIDIDTIYNCDGTFRLLDITEITNNFESIGTQTDSFYTELQKGA
jgi:uncharacterized protein (TIGR04255 family)